MASRRGARLKVLAARLVGFTKLVIIAAGTATAVSIAAIVSLQFGFWFMTRRWTLFPLSRLMELAGFDVAKPFVLASEDSRLRSPDWGEWLLDLPAAIVLFVVLAVLAASYSGLTALEKARPTTPDQG